MEYFKKLVPKEEAISTKQFMDELGLSEEYMSSNFVDYSVYDFNTGMDLIVKFLNEFSSEVSDEIDFNSEMSDTYKLNIELLKPISEEKFFQFNISQNNDVFTIGMNFGNKPEKQIDSELFNNIIAYLVSHGQVYDYEIDSTLSLSEQ